MTSASPRSFTGVWVDDYRRITFELTQSIERACQCQSRSEAFDRVGGVDIFFDWAGTHAGHRLRLRIQATLLGLSIKLFVGDGDITANEGMVSSWIISPDPQSMTDTLMVTGVRHVLSDNRPVGAAFALQLGQNLTLDVIGQLSWWSKHRAR